jgi:hypothetical protein
MSRKKRRSSQGQISLFPSPSLSERSILEQCLYQSLHSTAGAEERWDRIRAMQPTDAEVKLAIGYEFGIYGGSTYPQIHAHAGGANPKFWMDDVNLCNPPTLTGQALIDLVREILDL